MAILHNGIWVRCCIGISCCCVWLAMAIGHWSLAFVLNSFRVQCIYLYVYEAHAFQTIHGTKIQFKTIFIDEFERPFSVWTLMLVEKFKRNDRFTGNDNNVLVQVYLDIHMCVFVCWVFAWSNTFMRLFAICMENKALAIRGFSIGSNNKSAWVLFVCLDSRIGKNIFRSIFWTR